MQQRITLDMIRREATALEIDLCIVDGFLNLSKRGDASLFYRSVQLIDDPRVITDAWQWLQQYRTNVQRLDEARAQIAHQQIGGPVALAQAHARLTTQNTGTKIALARRISNTGNDPAAIFQYSFALTLGGIIGLLTNNCFLGVGTFLALALALFGLRRVTRRQRS
jgi:hypothetical protein